MSGIINSKETLKKITDAVADPIFVKDRDHRWVFLNDAYCKFMGYPRRELIGKTDRDYFPKKEADVFWQKDEEVFRTGRENVNEENFTDSHGVTHTILTKKTLFVDSDERQFIVGVIRDITDLKQAHEALIRQATDLARSDAEREHLELFAYVAAHDLREPLQRIIGFSDLLVNTLKEVLSDDAKKYLQKIREGTYRMSYLIDDLLAFSKVIKRSEFFCMVPLTQVVADVLEDLETLTRQAGAKINTGTLPSVQGDESQLRQLFHNLITNAVKFKKDGQPPAITIEAGETEGGFWEIAVHDEGIGLDPKYAEKIFKPFERLHSRDKYPGSGIGLAICHKIVAYHSGKISVRSKPGEGATFIILLPKY